MNRVNRAPASDGRTRVLTPVLVPRGVVEQSRRPQHEQVVRAIVLRRAANRERRLHIVRQAMLALRAQVVVYATWNKSAIFRTSDLSADRRSDSPDLYRDSSYPSHELTIAIDHTGTVQALVADADD